VFCQSGNLKVGEQVRVFGIVWRCGDELEKRLGEKVLASWVWREKYGGMAFALYCEE